MPHFIIDCSENIIQLKSPGEIMQAVYDEAESTKLFSEGDIKVRIHPFQHYMLGPSKEEFIHVFGNIMEGRTITQKADLSRKIVGRLKIMFPDVPIISMNVRDFEKMTYCNRSVI
jgi:5-carboxymethyl-2-hydroxymuconate isomerase